MYIEKIKVYLKRLVGFLKYARSCEDAQRYSGGDREKESDVVVVIAAHGRTEILLQVVNHLLNFSHAELGISISIVVCVSNLNDAERLDAGVSDNDSLHIIRCANLPLGNKWQQAINYAKLLNPKALIICGSDDLLSYAYLSKCLSYLDRGEEWSLCGPTKWHMIDSNSNVFAVRYKASASARVLGSGRVYSKVFLDQVDWALFDRYLDSGLDYRGLAMVRNKREGKLHIIDMEYTVMSVKGGWSMLNTLDDIRMSDRLVTEELSAEAAAQSIQEFGLQ
jgi:hypothetical protein